MLASFEAPVDAVVFGAGGGIGRAFVEHLCDCKQVRRVHAVSGKSLAPSSERMRAYQVDILDDVAIQDAALQIKQHTPRLIILATGILHDGAVQPEKTWRHLKPETIEKVLQVNTVAPALIMKHFLSLMPREGKSVFAALSARVGSISDNGIGGWYSYRASKAALNMMLKTASIELARRWPEAACIGLHPGTVDTGLSEPFQGNVPTKQLFSPEESTRKMLAVIDGLDAGATGQVLDYAGRVVPS